MYHALQVTQGGPNGIMAFTHMIPKIIHYCWFGNNPKNATIQKCLQSFKEKCPDFTIREWNEENFDVHGHPFMQKMYREKKWAFVSDYARLHILYKEGGMYLDTDMLILQDLSPLCEYECVLGEEEPGLISAGMIGSEAGHPFIKKSMEYYDIIQNLETIPRILTKVFKEYPDKDAIKVLPPHVFYPFDFHHIKEYRGQPLGNEVYGVHMWNYSWGGPFKRFVKKTPFYRFAIKVTEWLGIKELLKKLLGFI